MSFLLPIILILSFQVEADEYYYHYQDRKLNINKVSFRRYVYPQLNSLLKEYYHLVKKLNEGSGNLIELNKEMIRWEELFREGKNSCLRNQLNQCEIFMSSELKHVSKLKLISLKAHQDILKVSINDDANSLNERLMVLKAIKEFDQFLIAYSMKLQANLLLKSYQPEKKGIDWEDIHREISFRRAEVATVMPYMIPREFQQPFQFIWENMLKDTSRYVIANRNDKFLLEHLEDFNMSWNSFHMALTKDTNKFPSSLKKVIQIMHNRWNSVLKIILRGS